MALERNVLSSTSGRLLAVKGAQSACSYGAFLRPIKTIETAVLRTRQGRQHGGYFCGEDRRVKIAEACESWSDEATLTLSKLRGNRLI